MRKGVGGEPPPLGSTKHTEGSPMECYVGLVVRTIGCAGG